MTLRIGSHPSNLSLFVLRHRGVLESRCMEEGIPVVWTDYLRGGDSAQLLAEGTLDVVGTGSTPPVYAEANGLDVSYLGASPRRDANGALLVMKTSNRQDLAGARIACMKGSFTDHFIARILLEQGLTQRDITLVDLGGRESALALQQGKVDIWAAIDPWLNVAQEAKKVRTLAEVGHYVPNRSLFWCRESWRQQHPFAAEQVLFALADNDKWIARHPDDAARLLHKHMPDSVSEEQWQIALRARPWGIQPAGSALIAEQQQQADDLFAAGFTDRAIQLTLPEQVTNS